jgi:hypothetical protein
MTGSALDAILRPPKRSENKGTHLRPICTPFRITRRIAEQTVGVAKGTTGQQAC